MAAPCLYVAYLGQTGQLDLDDIPERCENPARWIAVLSADQHGITHTLNVPGCETHDPILSTAPGWVTHHRIGRHHTST